MDTITYRIDTRDQPPSRKDEFFGVAVRDLKRAGFTYDGTTKTWAGSREKMNHGISKGLDRGFIIEVAA